MLTPWLSHRWLTDRSGAVAIEFALILPFLAVLAVGLVDYGGLAHRQTQLEAAVRAGAQFALDPGNAQDTVGIQSAVYDAMGLDSQSGALTFVLVYQYLCPDGTVQSSATSYCDGGNTVLPGYYLSIAASEAYEVWLTYPVFPATFDITGEAQVRVLGAT